MRSPAYARVAHGVHVARRSPGTPAPEDLLASRGALLPPGGCFTHRTAARLHGWDRPDGLDGVPVVAAVPGRDTRPRRPGLRVVHRAAGVAVVPQHPVAVAHGRVRYADLWIRGTRTLQEYDGGVHRDPRAHRVDLLRDRELADAGRTRLRERLSD